MGSLALTPEQGYALVIAALDVVSGPSLGVHKRCRKAIEAGTSTSYPTVQPRDLVKLVDVLNEIRPGIADKVIADSDALRKERNRDRSRAAAGG